MEHDQHPSKSQRIVTRMMHEVHSNTPSTVRRANVSGRRREAMLRAIALNKARKAGAKIRRRPQGSGTFSMEEMHRGYRTLMTRDHMGKYC